MSAIAKPAGPAVVPAAAGQKTELIIEARGVEKTYDTGKVRVPALRGVDLTVARGEMIAIMGPSGCGKTTLLNCLSGLDTIDRGQILIAGTDLATLADNARTELVTYGLQADSYKSLLDQATRFSRGFLTLIEGFMLLGLIVGIAALGVISFRSVVERRQQIGMLRAIGYTRSMVAASFVIESTMITVLGIVSGAVLGLVLAWRLFASDYFFGSSHTIAFVVPWTQIAVFLAIALAASVLTAYTPAWRAARVTIAEALRYE